MALVPSAGGLHDVVQRATGAPPHLVLRTVAPRDKAYGITGPSPAHAVRHRASGGALDRVEHLAHGHARAGAEIVCAGLAACLEAAEGPDVGVGQIAHVHVVTDARAVRRRV